jgi:hypothetical protein
MLLEKAILLKKKNSAAMVAKWCINYFMIII